MTPHPSRELASKLTLTLNRKTAGYSYTLVSQPVVKSPLRKVSKLTTRSQKLQSGLDKNTKAHLLKIVFAQLPKGQKNRKIHLPTTVCTSYEVILSAVKRDVTFADTVSGWNSCKLNYLARFFFWFLCRQCKVIEFCPQRVVFNQVSKPEHSGLLWVCFYTSLLCNWLTKSRQKHVPLSQPIVIRSHKFFRA